MNHTIQGWTNHAQTEKDFFETFKKSYSDLTSEQEDLILDSEWCEVKE